MPKDIISNYRGYTVRATIVYSSGANKWASWVEISQDQTSMFFTKDTYDSAVTEAHKFIDTLLKDE